MSLLRPTRLLISEKFATYTIKWSYTIIWQIRVLAMAAEVTLGCKFDNKISNYFYHNFQVNTCPIDRGVFQFIIVYNRIGGHEIAREKIKQKVAEDAPAEGNIDSVLKFMY